MTEILNGSKAVIYQNSTWTINANLIGNYKDFMIYEDLLFPQGPDWKELEAEKIQIDSVDVDVKTGYNFTTPSAINQGYITKDIPVYMNFYMGNTATEEPKSWGKMNLSGKSAKGSMTTGVKSSYGSRYYKTVLSKPPEGSDESVASLVLTKSNDDGTIDDHNLKSENIILQKGRVVIYVRMADLVVEKGKYLTTGNKEPGSSSGSGSGSGSGEGEEGATLRNRTVVAYLKGKSGKTEQVIEVKKDSRKGKRNPPPQPEEPEDDREFIEKPIILENGKKSLILDATFFIGVTYHITYTRA